MPVGKGGRGRGHPLVIYLNSTPHGQFVFPSFARSHQETKMAARRGQSTGDQAKIFRFPTFVFVV